MNEVVVVKYNGLIAAYKNARLWEIISHDDPIADMWMHFLGIKPIEFSTEDGTEFPPQNLHEIDWRLTLDIDNADKVSVTFVNMV